MDNRERTLDLTGIRLPVIIRERILVDWAHDFWKEGLTLTKVRLNREVYEELKHDLYRNNSYIRESHDKLLSIDLGFGQVELEPND